MSRAPKNARNKEAFETVAKSAKGSMQFPWMPTVNTKPIYDDPWRPGKKTVFDLSKKLTDVLGDMVIYHCRLLIAKHKAMQKMDTELLQDYFGELQSRSYEAAWKGLRCWKPVYGLNLFVANHVRFTAMGLASQRKKDAEKGRNPVLVPSATVSDMSMTFTQSMELAEQYLAGERFDDAAVLYAKICGETSADYEEPELDVSNTQSSEGRS